MSQTAGHSDDDGPAIRLGFSAGQVVQELGWDEDCDDDLRIDIEDRTGTDLAGEELTEVADVILLWWRDGDGDLVDDLVDSLTNLDDAGVVWLLTPKVGREGHVDPSDIADAAPTAGLTTTSTVPVVEDWIATKLVRPRVARSGRR